MNEQLLQFIWQHQYFSKNGLQTTGGESIQIIRSGILNTNQGPDFSAAEIIIGAIKWVGNVELHIKASDWYKHKHQFDPLYQPIILHVVWEPDREVVTDSGIAIPCLHMAPLVSKIMLTHFSKLMLKRKGLPCANLLVKVTPIIWEAWQDRLVVERLSRRAMDLQKKLDLVKGDWNMLALSLFGYYMGGKINGVAFEAALCTLSFQQTIRLSNDPDLLNAWLMGLLQLLPQEVKDAYPNKLNTNYAFLKKKFAIDYAVPPAVFLRMRPAGFPTIRVSQMVAWLHENNNVFNSLTSVNSKEECNHLLNMQADAYWDSHFCFDQPAPILVKQVGQTQKDLLIINVIIPLIFTYGWVNHKSNWQEKAIRLLATIAPETNTVVSNWSRVDVPQQHALHTQALLELEKQYCAKKKCLHCAVGNAILKS